MRSDCCGLIRNLSFESEKDVELNSYSKRSFISKFLVLAKSIRPKNIYSFVSFRVNFFFQSTRPLALIFFNLIYTISPLLNFCEKMMFLNFSERCLKSNRTSRLVWKVKRVSHLYIR